MKSTPRAGSSATKFWLAGSLALCAGGWGASQLAAQSPAAKSNRAGMLIAPMVAVIEPCILQPNGSAGAANSSLNALAESCTGPNGSAARLVDSTLGMLGSTRDPRPPHLGYTLPVPLLQLFQRDGTHWEIHEDRVQRFVRTIRDSPYPAILYLFATHFASEAPLEQALSLDLSNIAETRDGPMPASRYYDSVINNWTVATTNNSLTERRAEATRALIAEICKLPKPHISKIKGVTLLGELHQMFPDFEAGMGFDVPYRVSDYGDISKGDFREFLRKEMGSIAQLNRTLATNYRDFDEIEPPSRDIRQERLQRFSEHIDSFAHGTLPISGWLYRPNQSFTQPAWVHFFLNGKFIGKTPANKGRQDVLAAKPEFQYANTGWRMDLDFRKLPMGVHTLDIFFELSPGTLSPATTRHISIMDSQQRTPPRQPQKILPASAPMKSDVQFHVDQPQDGASYYFNPLVPLWHQFRGTQVVKYLRFFENIVADSCLSEIPRYSHQIVPFTNPSWDANKFAITPSLQQKALAPVQLGVSLYGDASYGNHFRKWLRSSGHVSYGVTEFHPLQAMSSDELEEVLHQHETNGAHFLSFFAEPYWDGTLLERGHNMFSFDPSNSRFGSDRLYRSMQKALQRRSTSDRTWQGNQAKSSIAER